VIMNERVLLAFAMTLLAGLSTGIVSALAFFSKRTNRTFLSVAMGFSAGVMIYVSMIEIFMKAKASLEQVHGQVTGTWITTGSFFGGLILIAVIDRIIPSYENPHEARSIEEMEEGISKEKRRNGIRRAFCFCRRHHGVYFSG